MIGLIDGNNFFCSCERIFDPSLENKPIAVLSNNDSCAISRSAEFKALNIPMGTPYHELEPLIRKYGLILKSSNYALYGDISRRMVAILHDFSPEVEQYSIDEAYVHITLPADQDYHDCGLNIRRTILKWLGIPCGVGFAKTKTLAKIANHLGKKTSAGVFVMPDNPEKILSKTPVGEVWGVGRRLAPKLEQLGIRSAWQLACAEDSFLRRKFNVTLAITSRELRGEPLIEQDNPEELSQSISCSRSYGYPVTEFSDLSESVATYIARAAEKLRSEKQLAAGVNIYFQYYPEYRPVSLSGGFSSTTVPFDTATANTGKMLAAIRPKLRGIFIEGKRYKKSGILFFGLEPEKAQQLNLFADTRQDEKDARLSEALDQINRKFGKGTLFHLAEGIERPWSMKRNMLSPNYTTDWSQLPEVK